jgi:hypothetical protein
MKFSINEVKAALAEVQTSLRWSVNIPNPPASAGVFDQTLQIRIQTASVPEHTEELTQVELGGFLVNYTGKTTKNGEITLGFVEGTDAKVIEFFTRLSNARWSGDGTDTRGVQTVPTNELKCDLVMNLLAPDDSVTQSYTLVGCLFNMQKGINFGQTADIVLPQVNVSYDDFHITVGSTTW